MKFTKIKALWHYSMERVEDQPGMNNCTATLIFELHYLYLTNIYAGAFVFFCFFVVTIFEY